MSGHSYDQHADPLSKTADAMSAILRGYDQYVDLFSKTADAMSAIARGAMLTAPDIRRKGQWFAISKQMTKLAVQVLEMKESA